jgi:hypothetical protein
MDEPRWVGGALVLVGLRSLVRLQNMVLCSQLNTHYIYTRTHVLGVHTPSFTCREFFWFQIKKIQYLLNCSAYFRSVCIRLFKKKCLTKRDP